MDTEPEASPPPETASRAVPPPPPSDAAAVPAPAPAPAEVPGGSHAVSPTEDIPPAIERPAPTPTATVDMPPVEETAPASVEVELSSLAEAPQQGSPLAEAPQEGSPPGQPPSLGGPRPSLDGPRPSPPGQVAAPPKPSVRGRQAPSPAPDRIAGRPRKRRWPYVLGFFLSLVVAAALAVVLLGPGYVRGRILEEAQARGVILAFGDMDLSLSLIRLHDARIGLSGVRDFEAAAGWIEVEIADDAPRSIVAGKLAISMTGTDVLGALGTWKNEHADALSAPLSAEDAHLEWHPSAGTAPALALDGAKVAVDAQKGSIEASSARLAGRDAGALSLTWTSPPEGFVVEIRPLAPPLSAVHVDVRSTKEGARLKVTLERTPLGPLQAALGIPKGSEGIQVDGEVESPVPSLARPAPIDGTLRLSVKGYTPPHPRELDGILFGDTTTVRSKFQLAADLGSAKLTGLTAEAGALSLTGSGDVTREGLDARVTLKLKGSIPCTSLATSAAVARLGSGLGRIAGGLAAGALQGSVAVSLSVDAKASDVKGAKITQSARIGCKVSVPGLPTIILR